MQQSAVLRPQSSLADAIAWQVLAPGHLRQAHDAVNKMAKIDGHESACVAWVATIAELKVVSPVAAMLSVIKLAMMTPDSLGLYGDPVSPHPFGVETLTREEYLDSHNAGNQLTRTVHWVAESKRHDWIITSRNDRPALEGARFSERTQSV